MLTLYLACLAFGGVFLGLSLLGGDESHADAPGEVEVSTDVDVSGDLDLSAHADLSGHLEGPDAGAGHPDGDTDTSSHGEGLLAAVRYLSLRNLIFFAAFFGLTGTLLTLFDAARLPTLVAALGFGGAAALAIDRTMAYLRRSESGALPSLSVLGGARAQVLVGIDAAHAGKIAVVTQEQTQQLVARRHPKAAVERFAAGDTVVIVRFQDGVALVAEPTFLA
jgi:hypothetical protein